ncbi:MAG: hypothetical protein JO347_07895, partial [Candidatus Eremiobacteraeota bacterium]|nr:hypothetical protein [Candidatus Eremiobacteraeota bacterium]
MLGPETLLVLTVAGVGILHTLVPDHWLPIAVLARQHGWTRRETARAAFGAGIGHVTTTLLLGLLVWAVGIVLAARFGVILSTASSLALIAFGLWIAIGAWRELRGGMLDAQLQLAGAGAPLGHRHRHVHPGGVEHMHYHEHEPSGSHDVEAG